MGHVALVDEMRSVHKILVQKPEGKRPLRRLGVDGEDDVEMHLKEMGWGGVDFT